jgi:hypothetical protein
MRGERYSLTIDSAANTKGSLALLIEGYFDL